MSQNDKSQEWENWRKGIDQNMKDSASKLNSLSSQIKDLTETLKPVEKGHEDTPDFAHFMSDHVPDCPECKEVLKGAGYIKPPPPPKEKPTEKPLEKPTEKAPERWRVTDIGRKSESET